MPYKTKRRAQINYAARRIQAAWRKRRGKRIIRRKKPLALKTHTFVERSGSDQLDITADGLTGGLWKDFKLTDIPQYAQYCSIFELYTINKIVAEFRYKGPSAQARVSHVAGTTVVNEVNPVLYFKVDHNDADNDTLANLKLSMRTREHQFSNNKPNFTVTLKPAILIEDMNIKGTTGVDYRPKWNQYITTDEANVEFYGLKCFAVAGTGGAGSSAGTIEVTYKTYFTCKNND